METRTGTLISLTYFLSLSPCSVGTLIVALSVQPRPNPVFAPSLRGSVCPNQRNQSQIRRRRRHTHEDGPAHSRAGSHTFIHSHNQARTQKYMKLQLQSFNTVNLDQNDKYKNKHCLYNTLANVWHAAQLHNDTNFIALYRSRHLP